MATNSTPPTNAGTANAFVAVPNYIVAKGYYRNPPNFFDSVLNDEVQLWNKIQHFGGIEKVCCPGLAFKAPWNAMPPEGRRFSAVNSIVLPNVANVNTLVTTLTVPVGYDAVILSLVNEFTSSGFNEGSGQLAWRLQVNRRWEVDYGNVLTTMGSLTTPSQIYRGGIRIKSGSIVNFYVSVSPAGLGSLDPNGRIICAMIGYWYPR